ncbi:MAG TPA: hypothetical protein HA254_07595 [Candidatus Diapherotrites archaeon]|uniref:Uncharacterized protein n=1 Tax=Candidatus Iainarchaeum sp. TaxID=3101447 RepID=A0A7J4IY88_9ARCH|nr:hypothetical protein [Candidatus Diapherotrites archaeon]
MQSNFGSQRGFTLFTALVGFILIVLSLLLVQSMISTQRSTSDIITDISEQEEMQAIADLSRADALQVFNFGIRYTIEDFSTRDSTPKDGVPDNEYLMFSGSSGWGALEAAFVKDRFGVGEGAQSNQFATIAAKHLISLLERADDARGFDIELLHPNEAEMQNILKSTFNSQSGSDEFFQVIACAEQGSGIEHYRKCNGSFYITMDMSRERVNDSDYEKFPRVKVINQQSGRVLLEPILPRGKFRIFVPVRLFKALAGARSVGFSAGRGIYDDSTFNEGIKTMNVADAKNALEAKLNTLTGPLKEESDGFVLDRFDIVGVVQTGTPNDPADPERIVSYKVRLIFQEKNDKYRVSTQEDAFYAISLNNSLH